MQTRLFAVATLLLVAFAAQAHHDKPGVTTVIAVRHAERAPGDDDPALSAAGEERATKLASMLRDAGVTAIYSTNYKRTKLTGAPLAKQLGIEVITVDAPAGEALAKRILAEQRGKTVLVIGHSNTIPPLLRALGAAGVPDMPDTEFDNFYVAKVGEGETSVVRLHY